MGSPDKFGIRILPATLEIMQGGGRNSEVVTRWAWGISERDSKAWSESGGRPCGSSSSIQSPGHKVVEIARARRTTARREACCVERSSGRAVCEGGAIREGNQLLGRTNSNIIGLHKGGSSEDLYIQVFHDHSFKLEHMLSTSKGTLDDL